MNGYDYLLSIYGENSEFEDWFEFVSYQMDPILKQTNNKELLYTIANGMRNCYIEARNEEYSRSGKVRMV